MATILDFPQSAERLQVTIPEAAYRLSLSPRSVRRLIQIGELDVVGHGRGRRVPVVSLNAYIENNRLNYGKAYKG